jgi:hypothetical protein
VSDTVVNDSPVATARASTTRYYLSNGAVKIRLTGWRTVPILAAGAASTGAVSVTVATTTAPGTYSVIACADDARAIVESDDTNNCRASATAITVTQ